MNGPILEHDAQRLATAWSDMWEREWDLNDLCLQLTQTRDETWIRALGEVLKTSHRNIYRRAALAEAYPPTERALDQSPRTHAKWLRERASTGV